MHSLAALYAHQGLNLEAVNTLKQSVKVDSDTIYRGDDFYVLGVVAQNLGFPDIARAYYLRVEAQTEIPLATGHLARKRLAALAESNTQDTTPTAR